MKHNTANHKKIKRDMRHKRVRAVVVGTSLRPRLSVFRSLNYIYAQLIDDSKGVTLASASSYKLNKNGKTENSEAVGKEIATKAKALNVSKVVFDRGGYKYHGRVKALAEGARAGGLEF